MSHNLRPSNLYLLSLRLLGPGLLTSQAYQAQQAKPQAKPKPSRPSGLSSLGLGLASLASLACQGHNG